MLRISALVIALPLVSCSAIPSQDLREEYIETTRALGLTPVYPPREEFQVGDVFFVSYEDAQQSNLSSTRRVWLGTIDAMRLASNDYLRSRNNLVDTQFQGQTNNLLVQERQDDIKNGEVTLSGSGRDSLPIVSFPSVSGVSSSAGALGGFDFARSFGIGFGRSEQVNLDFKDTRAFGLPEGAISGLNRFYPEYSTMICPNLENARRIAGNRSGTPLTTGICGGGRTCEVHIISRTYFTRELQFTYTSARIANLALSRLEGDVTETSETLAIPGNLDISITVPEEADGASLEGLVAGLSTAIASARDADSETDGLTFAGLQANGLVFNRTFRKPVTIAYESLTFDFAAAKSLCSQQPTVPEASQ